MFINIMTYNLDISGFYGYLVSGDTMTFMEVYMSRRSPYHIVLSQQERKELEHLAKSYTAPYYLVIRAKLILMAAEGMDNKTIGERLSLPRQVVSKWRKRFFEEGLAGLEDRPRPGRPPVFSPRRCNSSEGSGV